MWFPILPPTQCAADGITWIIYGGIVLILYGCVAPIQVLEIKIPINGEREFHILQVFLQRGPICRAPLKGKPDLVTSINGCRIFNVIVQGSIMAEIIPDGKGGSTGTRIEAAPYRYWRWNFGWR